MSGDIQMAGQSPAPGLALGGRLVGPREAGPGGGLTVTPGPEQQSPPGSLCAVTRGRLRGDCRDPGK